LLLLLAALPLPGVAAQDTPLPAPTEALKKRLSLEFTENSLDECCRYFTGLGVKARCEPGLAKKPVVLRMSAAPAASILRQVAFSVGARARLKKDGTVLITSAKSYLPEVPSLDRPPKVRELTDEEKKRLVGLIDRLGADTFREREAASKDIRAFGPSATAAARAALKTEDPEAVQRLEAILEDFDAMDWRKEARRRLQKKVNFEFVQAPFTEAVNFLQQVSDVNMVVAPEIYADRRRSVTLKMTQGTLELALDWISRLSDAHWVMRDHAVVLLKGASPLVPVKPSDSMRDALNKKVNVEFDTNEFEDCVNYIRGLTDVNILTDPKAFGKDGVNPRTEIKLKLKDVTLETLLRKLCARVGLRVVICRGDVVFITSPEKKPDG
jgi:hypothetical protein